MSDTKINHDRTAKQCGIFDKSNTLRITILEDSRGDECTYTTNPTVINQVLSDFSCDASVTMKISEDQTGDGLILTLTDTLMQPVISASQVHGNNVGRCERDEEGWVWYSRSEFVFNKNGGWG